MRASVHTAMNQAYATREPKRARRLLENLARRPAPLDPRRCGTTKPEAWPRTWRA